MPGAGGQPPQRTTFRPPWVKDGPTPLPMPSAPWTLNSRRDSKPQVEEAPAFTKVTLKSVPKVETKPAAEAQPRKQSKITIIPAQPKSEKNTSSQPVQPKSEKTTSSQPVQPKSEKNASSQPVQPKSEKNTSSSQPAPTKLRENGRQEPNSRPQLERQVRIERSRSRGDTIPLSKSESTTGAPTLSKSSSRAAIPPPPPPRPPPPPPGRTLLKDLPPLNAEQQQKLEMLKQRPRKRPDWASMMKEVESGKRLRHVKCNDRSAPLIERVNKVTADPAGKAHFVFESEKSNMHNQLLKQIQQGVSLKRVQTNDRSRPMLEGLRKFRRQLTIEEQMQKADEPTDESISDEMDDIDAVRDDLQSTKQMLALELRNKEALERDNKRLQARILNLEAEVERAKSQKSVQEQKKFDEKITESLKKEAEHARKDAEKFEKEYISATEERDRYKNELEEVKRMYATLERRMKAEQELEPVPVIELAEDEEEAIWWTVSGMALAGCPSAKDVAKIASQKSVDKREPSESEEEEEEEEESSEEEDEGPKAEKRLQREIKLLTTKIRNFKDKATNARKERHALKEQIKQQQKLLKDEKKKYKHLQKEVDKMAKLMSESEEDEKEEEEEEEEETESEESESEESEEEEETETEDEDESLDGQRDSLQKQAKRHEGRLAALKKGNYLLKAQVDRLKDDLVKQREESLSLQEDLDSVLAELG